MVVPRVTESGVSAGSRGWKTGRAGRWTTARSQKPRVPDTVFRIACVRVLSGAVKEFSGSSRWDQHRETESRGAVSPSSQVLRASAVAARTRLHLSGTTLPLLNGQTTCPGRQEGSGCGTLPSPALPNPQLQGPSFLHWFSCLPVISAGLYASKKAFPWLSRMLSVACLSPTQSGAPMGLHRWAAVCLLRAAPGSQAGSQRLQLEASSLPGSWVTRPT